MSKDIALRHDIAAAKSKMRMKLRAAPEGLPLVAKHHCPHRTDTPDADASPRSLDRQIEPRHERRDRERNSVRDTPSHPHPTTALVSSTA